MGRGWFPFRQWSDWISSDRVCQTEKEKREVRVWTFRWAAGAGYSLTALRGHADILQESTKTVRGQIRGKAGEAFSGRIEPESEADKWHNTIYDLYDLYDLKGTADSKRKVMEQLTRHPTCRPRLRRFVWKAMQQKKKCQATRTNSSSGTDKGLQSLKYHPVPRHRELQVS